MRNKKIAIIIPSLILVLAAMAVIIWHAVKDCAPAAASPYDCYYSGTTEVFSLNWEPSANDETHEDFVYGIGYLDGEKYYVVKEALEDGSAGLAKYPAKTTTLTDSLSVESGSYIETFSNADGDFCYYLLYLPADRIEQDFDLSSWQ